MLPLSGRYSASIRYALCHHNALKNPWRVTRQYTVSNASWRHYKYRVESLPLWSARMRQCSAGELLTGNALTTHFALGQHPILKVIKKEAQIAYPK